MEFTGTLDGGRCHATAAVLADRFLAIAGGCERVEALEGGEVPESLGFFGIRFYFERWQLKVEPQEFQFMGVFVSISTFFETTFRCLPN